MPASSEMALGELKKVLRSLSYNEIESMICPLYRENKDVSRFLNSRFNASA